MPLRDHTFGTLEQCASCGPGREHFTQRRCYWCEEPTCAQCVDRKGSCPSCSSATHAFKSKGRGNRRAALYGEAIGAMTGPVPPFATPPSTPTVEYAYGCISPPNRGT